MRPVFDDRDRAILAERQAAFLDRKEDEGPRVGDLVIFRGGVCRRVTYVWPDGIQTGHLTGYYLGTGHMSYSGSLARSVPTELFTAAGRTSKQFAWFFHRDMWQADNGVHVQVEVPVWNCDVDAPSV